MTSILTLPSQCPSKFNIVLMVTGSLTGRMGDRLPVTIDMMLNFDGDGVGTCKQYSRRKGYVFFGGGEMGFST